jgi:hypothetical protein
LVPALGVRNGWKAVTESLAGAREEIGAARPVLADQRVIAELAEKAQLSIYLRAADLR